MLSVRQQKLRIVRDLLAAHVEQAEAERESVLIIEHVTNFNAAAQIMNAAEPLSADQTEQIDAILHKRSHRMPLQYCLGYQWFMGTKLFVEPGVFIPRTDTETLVVVAEELFKQLDVVSQPNANNFLAGEIGIGSGAVSISLLRLLEELQVVACDISSTALTVAAANACRNAVGERLQLLSGDWKQVLPRSLNAVISNPPYIPLDQKQSLQPEVRDYEPEEALFGAGEDGLGFYREIAGEGANFLAEDRGFAAVEVGDGQAEAVRELFAAGGWSDSRVHFDVNGLARVVSAWRW